MALNITPYSLIFTLLFICCFCSKFVSAITNITTTKFLTDPETLVSENATFKIGFFSPINSTNRYVGIWYNTNESDTMEVVWVANRNNPIKNASGVLKISDDGNLQLSDGKSTIFWSSNVSRQAHNTSVIAKLQDTGNLVLLSGVSSGMIIWQSFDHLTNSLLPQTTISIDMSIIDKDQIKEYEYTVLRSWKSASDPSNGRFRITVDVLAPFLEFVTWESDKPYSRIAEFGGPNFSMEAFPYVFHLTYNPIEDISNILYVVENKSFLGYHLLNDDGNVFYRTWDGGSRKWNTTWQSIETTCDMYSKCGPFGCCNPKNSPICSCLKGFKPKNIDEWNLGNWTSGCVRNISLQCSNIGGKEDGFLGLPHVKVPDNAGYLFFLDDPDECRSMCLGNCLCLAYAYPKQTVCMMWNESLLDMQQFSVDGVEVFIRLAHSELGNHLLFLAFLLF
ncbi:G-type lectin S-receptor-like serine/threonine-protein kinase At1g11300 [Beta vulgaris subsp. vulgaris]|uniref:G-type lectin S-receptor-like serine/threonine-protein kinase At1g11300 n=1 Tax=Beta vulgaris subsp. vulgaris TaxID=3555 RepID=UPI00053F8841|nr:G-type lectin S-receptor-like serine/threonine-protein kinase At1g11300 [Beta vulgaris subsp. vulgaris]